MRLCRGGGGGIATQLRTLDAIAGLPARLSVCGRAGMAMATGAVYVYADMHAHVWMYVQCEVSV